MASADEEVFLVGGIEVIQKEITKIDHHHAGYNGLNPSSTTLPKGYRKDPSFRGFEAATIWDRDIEVPLRDGVILRADVFRPAAVVEKVPALLVWSPYGKSGTGFLSLDLVPGRVGVPKTALSGFESFEAPDPAEWTAYGYAVVNIDVRGIMKSGGNHRFVHSSSSTLKTLTGEDSMERQKGGTGMTLSNILLVCLGAMATLL